MWQREGLFRKGGGWISGTLASGSSGLSLAKFYESVGVECETYDILQAVQNGLGAVPGPGPGLHTCTHAYHGCTGWGNTQWIELGGPTRASTREWVLVRT